MPGDGHAGFGRRLGETHWWKHQQGAPSRPHPRPGAVAPQPHPRCYVKDLAEGLFVEAAVLVAGEADEAVILGFAEQQGLSLGANGISVINVEGKGNLVLAHAILSGFGVRCYVVFDGGTGPKAMVGANKADRWR
ncbi:TOPRIM nucleotidyl transferase/hydrolase domain-containing protein [Streptomyces sp. V4I8]|uniref:TOPRIM nucleotidyl transferase/hydrolase domain-containing protein n=1 Tax=Streptomyces sp. V4I8 TaxID=3156469 RepID=UPI003519C419